MKIAVIGAGNVATHLAPAFEKSGSGDVVQVYSRTKESAETLCRRLKDAIPVSNIADLTNEADLYVISLPDHAANEIIEGISRRMRDESRTGKWSSSLWVHTSGSLPLETLSAITPRPGVFYPLQTFSRSVDVDMSKVPIFIEAANEHDRTILEEIAARISSKVHYADGDLRKRMHIAAVFACNFTNYMFTVADDLLRQDNLTLEVLNPLLEETVKKALAGNPAAGQTGPAVRGDMNIMSTHASMLPESLSGIYRTLSEAIYNRHHPTDTTHEQN
ncbi:MAG: DUF2520 domain-containing protein [Duncaniella sp.]|nr:DUF2520 domain-containing protein [Duncaniella sp.]